MSGVRYLPTSETNSLTMTLTFGIPFITAPIVTANVVGLNARYAVQGVNSSPFTFVVTVTRTDSPDGWTKSPMLIWKAIGPEVPDPKGFQEIGESDYVTANVTVNFPEPFDVAPNIFAWVMGTFANQTTYSAQMISVNKSGFQCTVRRTDKNAGWKENPVLLWTVIEDSDTVGCCLPRVKFVRRSVKTVCGRMKMIRKR
ncbi:unnamed protein product [Clavelina lepadiformis]|uniref:H-type lectin domain-containing protein n=1 Tax=Clavelina lepadiformis TaxID=159417 RepID=A0ABP0F4N7_CLALP